MSRSRIQRWFPLWGLSLLLLPSACTNELLVDVEQRSIQGPDADVEEAGLQEDAGGSVDRPDAASTHDAGSVAQDAGKAAAALDAGQTDAAAGDAGRPDAAQPDAGDAGAPEAGSGDAGVCPGPTCPDAGYPDTVPCPGGCGVMATFLETRCPNGAFETCWTQADGTCVRQCPPVAGCTSAGGCAGDEYCYFPHDDCGASSPGHCAKRPRSCPPLDSKVCGCNGVEYANGCVATQKGGTDVAAPAFAMCQ